MPEDIGSFKELRSFPIKQRQPKAILSKKKKFLQPYDIWADGIVFIIENLFRFDTAVNDLFFLYILYFLNLLEFYYFLLCLQEMKREFLLKKNIF